MDEFLICKFVMYICFVFFMTYDLFQKLSMR